ncbi:MAG: potassium transporter Kup [Gemmatimonadaceae bacterium]
MPTTTPSHGAPRAQHTALVPAAIAALGIVFGDIGTSPLYALKACFAAEYGLTPDAPTVYGVLSLILWSLTVVVSVKYVIFIMRADNEGEGGILALLALLRPAAAPGQSPALDPAARATGALAALGLFGAALLYGDGLITPAISVLSAVEGVNVATPALARFVVPTSVALLLALFLVQSKGTARLGGLFGPVMGLWFATIAVLGGREIMQRPGVLAAVNPVYAARFLVAHGTHGILVLGAVVLAVTGAEALYADMGHFGRKPIRAAWFAAVFPALLLNYFGQGALLLRDPHAVANPFYQLAPAALLYPLVVLASAATIIASQALISGAFSLARQTIQLGYSPRMRIVHTSASEAGQIYVPAVNSILAVGCLALVLGFRSSDALSAAYGIAVTGTMAITTLLFYVVARRQWRWSLVRAGTVAAAFLAVDVTVFGANLTKIAQGGWVPLVVASTLFLLMTTWHWGRRILLQRRRATAVPLETLLTTLAAKPPVRVPGTAVFLSSHSDVVPGALLPQVTHSHVLHAQVVLMSVEAADTPTVPPTEQVRVAARHLPLQTTRRSGSERAERFGSLQEVREAVEREYILKKLEETNGNVTRTAELLGLERSNLYRKMKTLGIGPKE